MTSTDLMLYLFLKTFELVAIHLNIENGRFIDPIKFILLLSFVGHRLAVDLF